MRKFAKLTGVDPTSGSALGPSFVAVDSVVAVKTLESSSGAWTYTRVMVQSNGGEGVNVSEDVLTVMNRLCEAQ